MISRTPAVPADLKRFNARAPGAGSRRRDRMKLAAFVKTTSKASIIATATYPTSTANSRSSVDRKRSGCSGNHRGACEEKTIIPSNMTQPNRYGIRPGVGRRNQKTNPTIERAYQYHIAGGT